MAKADKHWEDPPLPEGYIDALLEQYKDEGFTVDLHGVLDVVGFLPGIGTVADLGNGLLYLFEGDVTMAALSAASAVPIAGDLLAGGRMAVRYGDDVLGVIASRGDDVASMAARDADEVAAIAGKRGDDLPIGAACSFSARTMVRTATGEEPISELEPGDHVLALDENTGRSGLYPITAMWSHDDDQTGTIVVDGEAIEVTPDHPLRTVDRGWVEAADLQPGDEIVSVTGAPGVVGEIRWGGGPAEMWNITVETAHTYTIGSGQWLVHNECRPGVEPYQVGSFQDLKAASSPGDGLDIHHAPQDAVAANIIPGHTRADGPSIAIPASEHRLIPTLPSGANISPRDLLAWDIRNLRNFTEAPNSKLRELIDLARRTYPGTY